MTNGLPPHLSAEKVAEKADLLHNWLWSVVPVAQSRETWSYRSDGSNKSTLQFPLKAYLVGYCRNCNNGFSQEVPTNETGAALVTQLDIPKYGCVLP